MGGEDVLMWVPPLAACKPLPPIGCRASAAAAGEITPEDGAGLDVETAGPSIPSLEMLGGPRGGLLPPLLGAGAGAEASRGVSGAGARRPLAEHLERASLQVGRCTNASDSGLCGL